MLIKITFFIFFIFILFFIPQLSFVFVVLSCCLTRVWYLFHMLFVAMVSFFLIVPESYDYYRRVLFYNNISHDFSVFSNYYFTSFKTDIVLPWLSFYFSGIGVPDKIFFALLNCLTVYILDKSFIRIIRDYPQRRKAFLRICFVFSISYISIFSGIRYMFALSLFCAYVSLSYSSVSYNKILKWVGLILSFLSHFVIVFNYMIYILSYLMGRFDRRILLFFPVFVLLSYLSVFFLSEFNSSIPIINYAIKYLEVNGSGSWQGVGLIFKTLYCLPLFYIVYLSYLDFKFSSNYKIATVFLIILVSTIMFFPVFDRMMMTLFILVAFFPKVYLSRQVDILLYLSFCVLRFFIELYSNYDVYINTFLNFNFL